MQARRAGRGAQGKRSAALGYPPVPSLESCRDETRGVCWPRWQTHVSGQSYVTPCQGLVSVVAGNPGLPPGLVWIALSGLGDNDDAMAKPHKLHPQVWRGHPTSTKSRKSGYIWLPLFR